MAKTKKELQDQIPEEEQAVADVGQTESEQLPQTDLEQPASDLAGLELAAASTMDPDAPQTDMELGEALDDQAPASETGSEAVEIPTDSTQPDAQSAEGERMPETDLETGRGPGSLPDELTQPASEPGMEPEAPSEAGPAAEGDAIDTEPPKRRRRGTRKKADEAEAAADTETDMLSEAQSDSGQPQKLRMPGRRRQRVVSIDAERTVETDTDRLRSDLLDLVESFKSKRILTGTIQGVERLSDNPEMSYAVIYHGDFKVIIPVLEAIEEPEDYRGQPRGDVLHYLLNKRLGAEVDYIVKGIDQENNVVAASRLEAMALKRREYYFRTDRDGNYQIYEGIRAEARVISVIRAGIFVDLFGAETYIPLRELSYQRWVDAAQHYQPGQRVLVKVLGVNRSDRSHPRVTASVKQAMENPYEKALKKYVVGNRYVGTVSMVDLNGVFVSLDGGVDCLCTYPKRGRPPRGARATVRILGINHESNRIWGVITHMSTAR